MEVDLLAAIVKEQAEVHQWARQQVLGYRSKPREQVRRNPGQGHLGTGEPGQIGHLASQTEKDHEGA